MKNKKYIISCCIIGGLIVVVFLFFSVIMIICANKGLSISTGRFYLSENGDYMLIDDDTAIIMSNQSSNDALFNTLTNGDKILVVHDGIETSFPARTGVHYCFCLSTGGIDDIPITIINQFTSNKQSGLSNVQYIRTNGSAYGVTYPVTTIIRSRKELLDYYETNKCFYYLERQDTSSSISTKGFLDACDKYDDNYFKEHFLILVLIEENSSSIRHTVTGVASYPSGTSRVIIKRKIPEAVTMDMAQWHIFVEMDSKIEVKNVQVNFE